MTPRRAILVTLIGFVGCSALSPQADRTRYFVLRPLTVPERQPVSGGTSPSIGIGPIVIPDHLQHGLVTRLDSDEIVISDTDRWAEPLHELVSRALRQNLIALLHTERMPAYAWELSAAPGLAVTVEVLHFERTANGTAAEVRAGRTESVHRRGGAPCAGEKSLTDGTDPAEDWVRGRAGRQYRKLVGPSVELASRWRRENADPAAAPRAQ